MKLRKENFSKADQEEVELIAKMTLEGTGAEALSKEEYIELKKSLERIVLEDLYRRRYLN